MTRGTAVTVCVVAGEDRRVTRQFLARLRDSLGPHDDVVLTGQGRPPVSELAAWRLPAGNGELRRATGTAPRRPRPVVVFVEDRVEPGAGWLELLLEALAAPGVGAVAPRTNVADGDELYVGVPYRPGEHGLRRGFARELAERARGSTSAAEVLAGPCLALRREGLEALGGLDGALAGGFDPAALAAAVVSSGERLAVADGCYLHHLGGAALRPDPSTFARPLVTACMIVRDEEEELPASLASLAGFADEIVVYDTGSTDRTIEIAERAGARVARGYWDDDFGRARNDALALCRGQWIVWLDADESLVCDDPAGVRRSLASLSTEIEAYVVVIENLNGTEAGSTFTHPACRLFRRAYGHWDGHIHELVRARAGNPELARELSSSVRIMHRGYLQSRISGRAKAERNLRTSFGDLAGGSELEWGLRLSSLGRSYVLAGRIEEGLDHCRRAVEVAELASTARLALRTVANCLIVLGRPAEALTEIDRLRAISDDQTLADAMAGSAYLALGEPARALEVLERVRATIDDDGFEYSPASVAVPKAEALRALGRWGDAADTLLSSIEESGGVDAHIGLLVECLELAGRDLGEIHAAVGPDRIEFFLPQLLQLQPPVADRVLEAWHRNAPGSRELLATAALVAHKLEIARQLVWSSRLRTVGFPHACPLVVSAADSQVPPRDRVLAAAAAVAMFSDPRARQAFGAAVLSAPASLRSALAAEVSAIAPQLGDAFESLGSPAERPRARGRPRPAARSVLVVDRELSNLRTAAMAALFARNGHTVTLLQPLPALSSTELLGPLGVTVRGWEPAGDEETTWRGSCEAALAWATAEASYDVAVVSLSAVAVLPALRRLLPVASVVVDLDMAPRLPPGLEPVDLATSAAGIASPGTTPVAAVDAISTDVLPAFSPVPLAARTGLCVAGNLRCAPPAAVGLFTGTVAPLLRSVCAGSSIAVCGDDPAHELARALPSAVVAGPVADPSPWIGSARVLLVTHDEGAEHWLAAAAACGTPALVVPGEASGAGQVAAAVGALLTDDALWRRFSPARAPRAGGVRGDPLTMVEPSRRARGACAAPSGTARAGAPGGRPEIRIVGRVYGLESLAQVNRELATHLACAGAPFDVAVLTPEIEPFPQDSVRALASVRILRPPVRRPADVEIRHQWPPDFTPVTRGRLVCIQPWEFGGLPAEWVAPLRDVVDELWVPTSWVRECAVRSGVPGDRVHVVANGVDVARFRPEGRRYPLRTTKATKLLFVGGLIERKGVDALLEAYLSSFTRDDDICLVVKPFGSQSVYSTSTLEREVRQAAAGGGAEIEMIDGDLGFEDMAALYRSCDALVHPYRGEGFGMPIVEAMASGLPVVVSKGGACLDFCDDANAWLVSAREVAIRPGEWTPSAPGNWWLEPSRRELAAAMRAVLDEPGTAKRKGAEGRRRAAEQFTWEAAAGVATRRISALLGLPAARSLAQAAP